MGPKPMQVLTFFFCFLYFWDFHHFWDFRILGLGFTQCFIFLDIGEVRIHGKVYLYVSIMYVYLYPYTHIHVYIYIYIYIYTYTYIYIYMYVCIYIYIYICMHQFKQCSQQFQYNFFCAFSIRFFSFFCFACFFLFFLCFFFMSFFPLATPIVRKTASSLFFWSLLAIFYLTFWGS